MLGGSQPRPPDKIVLGSWSLAGRNGRKLLQIVADASASGPVDVYVDGVAILTMSVPGDGAPPSVGACMLGGDRLAIYLMRPPDSPVTCRVYVNGLLLQFGQPYVELPESRADTLARDFVSGRARRALIGTAISVFEFILICGAARQPTGLVVVLPVAAGLLVANVAIIQADLWVHERAMAAGLSAYGMPRVVVTAAVTSVRYVGQLGAAIAAFVLVASV